MLKELDTVALTENLPDHNLQASDIGTIVHVHSDQQAFIVEFVTNDGATVAVVTLSANQVRSTEGRHEILHLREVVS